MFVKVSAVEKINRRTDVEVDPLEFLKNMKSWLCNVPRDAYVKDGKIVTCYDVSYHGSPLYEYKTYEVSNKDFEIIKTINELEKLIEEKSLTI